MCVLPQQFNLPIKRHRRSPRSSPLGFRYLFIAVMSFLCLALSPAHAVRVQFQTFLGDFEADLFDQQTPITSAAFLALVDDGVYNGSIIHRIDNNVIMQGGAYNIKGDVLTPIQDQGVARSEVLFSNVRGTLAYVDPAELSTSARSAQWFINLEDNSDSLDHQNGGYTVFGRISASGMAVVDAIAQLEKFNFENFPDLPLRNYSTQDAINGEPIKYRNYAVIKRVVTLDNGSDLQVELPPLITQATPSPMPSADNKDDDSIGGIGALGLDVILALLTLLAIHRRLRSNRQ